MVHCDNCGSDVSEIWRRRDAVGTMTHRTISWLCRDCHPSVPKAVGTSNGRADVAIADGGNATFACPSCGGATIDGQGLSDCVACSWSGIL